MDRLVLRLSCSRFGIFAGLALLVDGRNWA
jgi:hypothetical protein